MHTYLLEWRGDAPPPSGGGGDGPSLLVAPVMAAPGFDSSDMAYIRHAHEIEYFAHHRWVDTPARMLEPLLVQAAEQTGVFGSVSQAGSRARADLRLDSRLLHLLQFCRLEPSELQLALRLSLVDVATGRVLGERTLSVAEPLATRTPYAGVEAANRAVERLMTDVELWLAERVPAGQP
jgi:cholesterol transport system auxiliary component